MTRGGNSTSVWINGGNRTAHKPASPAPLDMSSADTFFGACPPGRPSRGEHSHAVAVHRKVPVPLTSPGVYRPSLLLCVAARWCPRVGLKVPEGNDRRELYKSQYRAIYTYKMSAQVRPDAPPCAGGRDVVS